MNTNCFWKERQNPPEYQFEDLENFWNNVAPYLPGVRRLDPNVNRKKIFIGLVATDDMSNLWSPISIRRIR